MRVKFSIHDQDEDVDLDVDVLSTLPVKDTFLLITRYEEKCNMMNNKDSAPYHTHMVRAVDHLVYGSVQCGNRRGVVLAACLCGSELHYALVKQDHLSDGIYLASASDDWEGISGDRVEMFNYEQFAAARRALALDVLSLSDFVSNLISSSTDEHRAARYDINREREVKVEQLLSDAGHLVWLDEEEKRTTSLA